MSDAVGVLRARVTLESPTRVADEIGGAAIVWTDQGDAWAEIVADAAGERAAFDTSVATARFAVTVRRREIAVGWRLVWGARTLRVRGVRDDGGARIALICEEERP